MTRIIKPVSLSMDPQLHKRFYHTIHTIATAHQVYDSSTDNFASVH